MTRKEKAAETEAALKAAARRVFAERGYLNTKIADITAEAGRAVGSFYNHFQSKEELLESLLADLAAESDMRAEQPGHSPDFSDPAAIRWHIAGYVRIYRGRPEVVRALREAALVSEDFARVLGRFEAAQRLEILDHLRPLQEPGHRLPAPPEVCLHMLFGLVDGFLATWPTACPELEESEAVDSLTRFIYRGLTGRDF